MALDPLYSRPMQQVGIFAPSSPVGQVELRRGIEFLGLHNFKTTVHKQVAAHHFTFAGTDQERAGAMYELANNRQYDILWAARGGYGAQRLLPILADLTRRRGRPAHKLLIGYSDITVLHEFVRREWKWSTLHAPMPSAGSFATLKSAQWRNILDLARGEFVEYPASEKKLTWMTAPPRKTIRAELVGGNLSLWQSLTGTPWSPTPGKGRILFFEDVDEKLYRIDRMIVQIAQAGLLDGAAAIVLGDFTNCDDESNTCLAPDASGKNPKRIPLRRTFSTLAGLKEIFLPVCRQKKIPLARGLPVGHGPSYYPLPLGAKYELSPAGQLKLLDWAWAAKK